MSGRISNLEKVLVFIYSSDKSYRTTLKRFERNPELCASPKFDNKFLVGVGPKRFVEKDKKFSDIDSVFLLVLQEIYKELLKLGYDRLLEMYLNIYKNFEKSRAFFEKALPLNEAPDGIDIREYRFCKYFGKNRLNRVLSDFGKALEKEINERSEKSYNFSRTAKGSFDDSAVDLMHRKKAREDVLKEIQERIVNATELSEIEEILLMYASGSGCDWINAFLLGDLSLIKLSNKATIQRRTAGWGTPLELDPETLMQVLDKALKLKNNLMTSEIDKQITVYRGLSLIKLTNSVESNNKNNGAVVNEFIKVLSDQKSGEINLSDKNIVYQSKAVTSTSVSEEIAKASAVRTQKVNEGIPPIVMKIDLKSGTAFGKSFADTKFGSDDYYKETMLMPNQKIKINSAERKGEYIYLNCVTVK